MRQKIAKSAIMLKPNPEIKSSGTANVSEIAHKMKRFYHGNWQHLPHERDCEAIHKTHLKAKLH